MFQRDRKLFSLLAPLFACVCTLSLSAQTPTPPPSPTAIQAPQIQSRPIPQGTVGVDPSKVLNWTLREAIMTALERNVDIQLERENVRLAEFDLYAARGVYDPTFTSTLSFTPQRFANSTPAAAITTPSGNVIEGVGKVISVKSLVYNFGMSRQIEREGGQLQVNFNNTRTNSNRSNFDPQYQPQFSVGYIQPLLRNRKIDQFRRTIRIQKKQLDLSDAQFRQRAIQIISQVQQAYWDLAFALRDEEIQREAVKLAETQLANNQRQVEVGTLAPIDVVTAATSVESRRIAVISAMNQVTQAENTLKQLVAEGQDADVWTAKIKPVESFEVQPVTVPLEEAVRLARENRPELKQLLLQKDINATNIDFFRDQTKPQVDAFATYTPSGLGGEPTRSTFQRDRATGEFLRDANGNFITNVDPDFRGGYFTSLRNLLSNKYHTVQFGLTISIPWKNRVAEANLGRALEDTKRIDLMVKRQELDIEAQIRNDVQAIEFAKMRIEAARAQQQFAQQQLEGEEKRFAAGLTTTFFVLQRQNDFSIAKGQYIRALTDYNKLVAQLQRDIGTTLSNNNIEVKSEANPDGDKK
ncbi:MAG TPA: TolC family protein [Blastocatellia bacterium]|nr:TolC family protein [Blastocatellia bacterium]